MTFEGLCALLEPIILKPWYVQIVSALALQIILPLPLFCYIFFGWFQYLVAAIEHRYKFRNYRKSEFVKANTKFDGKTKQHLCLTIVGLPLVCWVISVILTLVFYLPVFILLVFYWLRMICWQNQSKVTTTFSHREQSQI